MQSFICDVCAIICSLFERTRPRVNVVHHRSPSPGVVFREIQLSCIGPLIPVVDLTGINRVRVRLSNWTQPLMLYFAMVLNNSPSVYSIWIDDDTLYEDVTSSNFVDFTSYIYTHCIHVTHIIFNGVGMVPFLCRTIRTHPFKHVERFEYDSALIYDAFEWAANNDRMIALLCSRLSLISISKLPNDLFRALYKFLN